MIYVLIIMLSTSGAAIGSVEFNTKEACETAAKAINTSTRPYGEAAAMTVCVAKG